MIEIKHKRTGKVLKQVEAGTLAGADLGGAYLTEADLTCAILGGAYLQGADLRGADLRGAEVADAYLRGADLRGADLTGAILTGAYLGGAHLTGSDLSDAELRGADLSDAHLIGAHLIGADLVDANLWRTVFAFCDNLHEAKGLEEVIHEAPSSLDAHTLRASVCKLPDVFLQGVGYTPEEIENLRAMYQNAALRYYSCFISFADAGEDREFADKLHQSLIANNVTNWYFRSKAPRGGVDLEQQLDTAIKAHDKLVLICSRRSVYRENVVKEILRAIEVERETGTKKLFPIRLDDHILSPAMMEEAREKVKSGEWKENWVYYVRKLFVPDFSKWNDHDSYNAAFELLLRDLKSPAAPS